MKSPGSNALVYMAACPFGTVISNSCGSVERTLTALEIKCYVLCGFSCLFVLCSQQTMRLPQSSSFTQHAKQVSLSVMSPFCGGECAFST